MILLFVNIVMGNFCIVKIWLAVTALEKCGNLSPEQAVGNLTNLHIDQSHPKEAISLILTMLQC